MLGHIFKPWNTKIGSMTKSVTHYCSQDVLLQASFYSLSLSLRNPIFRLPTGPYPILINVVRFHPAPDKEEANERGAPERNIKDKGG